MNYGYSLSIGCFDTASGGNIVIPPPAAFAPVLTLEGQIAGSDGTPDSIPINYSYAGTDIVDLYVATGTIGFAITEAALVAGSGGGGVEFEAQLNYMGQQLDLSSFLDDTVTELAVVAIERTGTGTSGIQRVALTNIDLSAPLIVGAEVGAIDATTLRVTFDDTMFGTTEPADWIIAGATVSVADFTPGTTYVDLTLDAAVANGDDLANALAFDGANLSDERGNLLAGIAGQDVANNVAGSASLAYLGTYHDSSDISAGGTLDFVGVIPGAGTFLIGLSILDSGGGSDLAIGTTGVITAATQIEDSGTLAAIKWILVTSIGAGDLQILNNGSAKTFDQQIAVYNAQGLTNTDAISASDTGPAGQAPASLTLTAVPDGYFVAAMTVFRSRGASGYTWSAGLTEDFDTTHGGGGTHNVSSASAQTSGVGDLTITVTQTGGGGGDFGLAAVALKAA